MKKFFRRNWLLIKRRRRFYIAVAATVLIASAAVIALVRIDASGHRTGDIRDIASESIGWESYFQEPPLVSPLGLRLKKSPPLKGQPGRTHPRILAIGFDGASWKAIKPLMGKGEMPNLARLCSAGSYGLLATDVGTSPVSWTSIITGTSALQHGVGRNAKKEESWRQSYRRRVFNVFDLLTRRNFKIGIAQYEYFDKSFLPPGAFYLGSGPPIPDNLMKRFDPGRETPDGMDIDSWQVINKDVFLMRYGDYDFFFTVFPFPDEVHHCCYQQFSLVEKFGFERLDGQGSVNEEVKRGALKVRERYRIMDRTIGIAMDLAPDYIFILSDHGIHNENVGTSLDMKNELFAQIGLGGAAGEGNDGKCEFRRDKTKCRLYGGDDSPAALNIRPRSDEFPWFGDDKSTLKIKSSLDYPEYSIVYENRPPAAFRGTIQGATKLSCGKFPCLNVDAGERELKFRPSDEVIEAVKNGKADWDYFRVGTNTAGHGSGDPGILVMAGRGIISGREFVGARLFDFVPTLMYLLDEPVAKDLDGKILMDAVAPDFRASHPLRYVETYGRPVVDGERTRELSPEEIERLKALGYLN